MISPSEAQGHTVTGSDLLIRRMRDADVPELMPIEAVSFGRHHWSDESFFNELNNHVGRYYSLINTQQSRLIGYCGYWLLMDEAHITTVAIQPDLRGNALGELLLVHMLEKAMGQSVRWVTLEVRATNYGAQNLYYKYLFNSVGLRPKYYQDNHEDALIMTTMDMNRAEFRARFKENAKKLEHRIGAWPSGYGE